MLSSVYDLSLPGVTRFQALLSALLFDKKDKVISGPEWLHSRKSLQRARLAVQSQESAKCLRRVKARVESIELWNNAPGGQQMPGLALWCPLRRV